MLLPSASVLSRDKQNRGYMIIFSYRAISTIQGRNTGYSKGYFLFKLKYCDLSFCFNKPFGLIAESVLFFKAQSFKGSRLTLLWEIGVLYMIFLSPPKKSPCLPRTGFHGRFQTATGRRKLESHTIS